MFGQLIIIIFIIISTGYGLIYNFIRNIKEKKTNMLIYFTNISNLVIFIYSILLIISLLNNKFFLNGVIENSIVQYSLMVIISITMIIYHVLLKKNMKEKEKDRSVFFTIQNRCLHYITPLLFIIYWIIWGKNKMKITYINCLYWIILPLIYFCGVLIRAKFIKNNQEKKKYPYYFIDLDALKKKKFYINICIILFTFILISEIIYVLIRILY